MGKKRRSGKKRTAGRKRDRDGGDEREAERDGKGEEKRTRRVEVEGGEREEAAPAAAAGKEDTNDDDERRIRSKKEGDDRDDAGVDDESPPSPSSSPVEGEVPDADGDDDEEDDLSSDDDDDLVLEGVLTKRPDSDGEGDGDGDGAREELSSDDDDDEGSEDEGQPAKKKFRTAGAKEGKGVQSSIDPPAPARKESKQSQKKKKGGKKKGKPPKKKAGRRSSSDSSDTDEDAPAETLYVEFTFCDMDEKYFHGLRTLLLTHPVCAPRASPLADLMIENVSVGTVVSTEDVDEGDETVFGYASVLNLTTNGDNPGVRRLREACLEHCPAERREELETVLGGKTKRPAGLYLHGRMINLPLEIVEVLHQQLVLDMDWAVDNAEGGEEERKSLDFGAFVLLAPCLAASGGGSSSDSTGKGKGSKDGKKMPPPVMYKNFDDEVFAGRAEFVFTFEAPRRLADEDRQFINVVVMTKTGHREAMKDLAKLVGG